MTLQADFNVSAMVERYKDKKIQTVEGTMYFYAPETCSDDVSDDDKFDAFPLDIWALGVTTFAMTYLVLPFTSENNCYNELMEKITKKEVVFRNDIRKISKELENLLKSMLEKDPNKRATCKELLSNNWLNDGISWMKYLP